MGERADALVDLLGGDVLQADGLDDAIIGYVERCGEPIRLVYDRETAIDILMNDIGDREAAEEYFDFNTAGAWVGEQTPFWFTSLDDMNA
jgi:hypothetical protein